VPSLRRRLGVHVMWRAPDLVVTRPDPAACAMTTQLPLEPVRSVDIVHRPPWDMNTVRQSLKRLDWWLSLDKRPRF
jgi:hypothetical protein